jgi:hypothetical protein
MRALLCLFLKERTISRNWADRVFEADILHHAIAFQNFVDVLDLDRQTERIRARKRPRLFAVSVSGMPAVRLRMLEQAIVEFGLATKRMGMGSSSTISRA